MLMLRYLSHILFVICMVLSASAHEKSPPWNIIYIMADDVGYGDLSCFGATKIQTPHGSAQGVRSREEHNDHFYQ